MLRSIQSRIVLGSVIISAVVLMVLALVVGEQLHRIAGAAVANQTSEELRSYVADLRNQPDERPDLPDPGEHILVLSPEGRIVVDTLPAGIASAITRSGSGPARIQSGGVGYLAVGASVSNRLGRWRLWAVRSSVSADQTVQGVVRVLLLVLPVILALLVLGSWLLVRASLRPVRRLRTAAEVIKAEGAVGRLPPPRGRDEIAALTVTLDGFLEAQHDVVERERRMIADASHELRTPLAVLTTQLELAHRQFGDSSALERAIIEAEASVRGLTRLTTQLLELSQLETSVDGVRSDETSLSTLVTELMAAIDRARALAPHELEIDFDVQGGLDEAARVRLSAVGFGRIVDNLVMNAVHATSAGSVEVFLKCTAADLVLTVADTGVGVPLEFLPHAFDRFARSERSRVVNSSGSGLGLALARALASSAGGTVTLANRDGGGAVATVVLPLLA